MRKKFSLKRMIVITDILIKLFYLHFSCKKVVEDSKENLKVIKNTLPNKSENLESLKK